ncbi:MAG: hypothetical protein KC474_12035 [Cyanobacteria bacterium HKST-UBA04]|nr:hypothetical protein [Cyanobacteria bacterium HKST-UBA04]
MRVRYALAMLACSVGVMLPVMAAGNMEAPAELIENTGQRYKQFTVESFQVGDCTIEKGATVRYFPDGSMNFNAVLSCNHPQQYGFRAYDGSADNDLELEANFVGLNDRHFDEEFDADVNVSPLQAATPQKEGTFRYRWEENRPANHRRGRAFDQINHMYMVID